MRAVVFAYHDVGCAGIRTLRSLGIDVALVHTHDDDPGEAHWFGSVRRTCDELGIPWTFDDPHEPDALDRLRALAPDAIFSLYYRSLLGEEVLQTARRAAVNLHGSLLPRYRGRAPVNWMLLHGEREGGVTLHHMVRRADAGDLVDQEAFPIGPDDTAVDVYRKMLPAAELVLRRSAVAVIEGTAPRFLQMESKATKFGRRRPEDGRIEWRWAAEDVRNLVRAVTKPYPGAFTDAAGTRVLVWSASHVIDARVPDAAHGAGPAAPGTLLRSRGAAAVVCGDRRCLRLERIEIGGREGGPDDFPEFLKHGIVLGGA